MIACTQTLLILLLVAVTVTTTAAQGEPPNFIVLQPDDLQFFEEWLPPSHFPSGRNRRAVYLPEDGLPNIQSLIDNGIQMTQAYTVSPMCGTSRYSTITGRYPSRSSYNRNTQYNNDVASITIPHTKLEDLSEESVVIEGNDCSENNIAQIFKSNNYRTGMVGKWHLTKVRGSDYTYEGAQSMIRNCGFDYAESIYVENQNDKWHDGTFSHNIEYMTSKAIEFINQSDEPFFLYVNPTAPHGSGNVQKALTEFSCMDTPAGRIPEEPIIVGMTDDKTCTEYRDTILERATSTSNNDLGSIWIDDAIGAILQALGDKRDNTFFLFQMDHGQEGKNSLLEPGTRIAQFIHFPNQIIGGQQFNGIVSTIDIGPTMLDYAGIITGIYEMDGKSWKDAINNENQLSTISESWNEERCLYFELGRDRALRCGCYKYMKFFNIESSNTKEKAEKKGLLPTTTTTPITDDDFLFNICDSSSSSSSSSPGNNPEQYEYDIKNINIELYNDMSNLIDCHLERTKPNQEPQYYDCDDTFVQPDDDDDESCQDSTEPFVTRKGKTKTCQSNWILKKRRRCNRNRYGEYCPEKCGHCD